MWLTMIIMSKMIMDYVRIFPESEEIAKSYPKSFHIADFCSRLASNLPKGNPDPKNGRKSQS
jgi:hypothetical protein